MKTLISVLILLASFQAFAGPFKDFRALRRMHNDVTRFQQQAQSLQNASYGGVNAMGVCSVMPQLEGQILQSIAAIRGQAFALANYANSFNQTADFLVGQVQYLGNTCRSQRGRSHPVGDRYILETSARIQNQAQQLVMLVESAIRN